MSQKSRLNLSYHIQAELEASIQNYYIRKFEQSNRFPVQTKTLVQTRAPPRIAQRVQADGGTGSGKLNIAGQINGW